MVLNLGSICSCPYIQTVAATFLWKNVCFCIFPSVYFFFFVLVPLLSPNIPDHSYANCASFRCEKKGRERVEKKVVSCEKKYLGSFPAREKKTGFKRRFLIHFKKKIATEMPLQTKKKSEKNHR